MVVSQLVKITRDYKLDGWLINIENILPRCEACDLVENVQYFLRQLSSQLNQLKPDGVGVIWYDSVTIDGKLQWQDGLTPLNKPFFDACDGLFVNYTWGGDIPFREGGQGVFMYIYIYEYVYVCVHACSRYKQIDR